jgi:beta-lactamase superfamily II metal-dependent hydrolase
VAATLKRQEITAAEAGVTLVNPLAHCDGIGGVVVHDVGQGDAISIVDEFDHPVLRVDYGGQQSSPFKTMSGAAQVRAIDAALPVAADDPIMLTHWDEDHWCSARIGTHALSQGRWLAPRQWTSPRAVKRSAKMQAIACVPELLVGTVVKFEARNGDAIWWEKLRAFDPSVPAEDCNFTGVALSVTSKSQNRVIFLPGDAPFHKIGHYELHKGERQMRGLVAFHHGSGAHWTAGTTAFLADWQNADIDQTVVFSCGTPNSHDHPDAEKYLRRFASRVLVRTSAVRGAADPRVRISF